MFFFEKIPKIAFWTKKEANDPKIAEQIHCLNIATSRWFTCNRPTVMREICKYQKAGFDRDTIVTAILSSSGVMKFHEVMSELGRSNA